MLSKNQRKHIRQLSQKKYRQQTGMFVAEGEKVVRELLDAGWNADSIYSSSPLKDISTTNVDQSELERISHFSSASRVFVHFSPAQNQNPKNKLQSVFSRFGRRLGSRKPGDHHQTV